MKALHWLSLALTVTGTGIAVTAPLWGEHGTACALLSGLITGIGWGVKP